MLADMKNILMMVKNVKFLILKRTIYNIYSHYKNKI